MPIRMLISGSIRIRRNMFPCILDLCGLGFLLKCDLIFESDLERDLELDGLFDFRDFDRLVLFDLDLEVIQELELDIELEEDVYTYALYHVSSFCSFCVF